MAIDAHDEKVVRELLSAVYTPEGVDIWLHAQQDRFGGRSALQCIEDGNWKPVAEAIDQLVHGAMG